MAEYLEYAEQPTGWRRLRLLGWGRAAAMAYGLLVALLILSAYTASHLHWWPHDPTELNYELENALPSRDYWLGTDYMGRDLLTRLIIGTQAFVVPGLLAIGTSLVGGLLLGILAGYWPGRFATPVGLLLQLLEALPKLVLILLVVALFKPDILLIMAVVGITNIPAVAELLRARIAVLRRKSYIEAALALGLPTSTVIVKHVLWLHGRGLVLIHASIGMAEAILIETSLSYLGFGVQEPDPSWGSMVAAGKSGFFEGKLWPSTLPAMAILATILGFHLLGDALLSRLEDRGAA
ncbi:MAG: ABC transporter permease [Vicinamibacteria bacterium]|jgi:peptide/nickel transport system permease protein|nr:ABC transporter permease [Vicinamibacteria bacterium]